MKIFNKRQLIQKRFAYYFAPDQCKMTTFLSQVASEIELWRTLNHPLLLKLYQIIDDPDHHKIYLVMELCPRG